MRLYLLRVPIDSIDREEALRRTAAFLNGDVTRIIATPNPEMLVDAQRDPTFLTALQEADLTLPDGFGLKIGAWIVGARLPHRITGADFMIDVIRLASANGQGVCLLGGLHGVGEHAIGGLTAMIPGVDAIAIHGGEVREEAGRMVFAPEIADAIRSTAPIVLFVALGHGKQERWMADHRDAFPSVRVMMGVGGAIDFLAGRARRAPRVFRRLGLEWLWRLVMEPRRLPRILKAIIIFPWRVIVDKVRTGDRHDEQ